MKKWSGFILFFLLQMNSFDLSAKDLSLFNVEGKSNDGEWSVQAKFYSTEKPTREYYKTCIRQQCSGDPMEGTYQCNECEEYSELKERINWTVKVATTFYYRNEIKSSGIYVENFKINKMKNLDYTLSTSPLYSQSCNSPDICFRFLGFNKNSDSEVILGHLDKDLNPTISIIGNIVEGRMVVDEDHQQTKNLSASYIIKK